MSKNKQTVQTLFKVGFIFGLIFGILSAIGLAITIIGLAFGVLCIISAVMSKKLSQQEEWAQKDLILVLVFSFLGGNIVTAIGAIIALIDGNNATSESAPAEAEQVKEEKTAEEKTEGEAVSTEKQDLSAANKNELVAFILGCCAVVFSPVPFVGVVLGLIALLKWKANVKVELTEQPYATFHKITIILAIVGVALGALFTLGWAIGLVIWLFKKALNFILGLIPSIVLL